ncbi:MAG: hypothetical protein IJ534_02015 [Bacteroidaceae bacterium]|nr:hypothetical protein [Bacteroidaceae bacterium]
MLDRTKNLRALFALGELNKTSYKTEDNNEPPLEAVEKARLHQDSHLDAAFINILYEQLVDNST